MTIVDELKKLITVRGGEIANIRTISEAVAVLTELENENTEEPNTEEPSTP